MGTPQALKSGLLGGLLVMTLIGAALGAPAKTPLPVKTEALHPITFSRLIVRLENEDEIGVGKAEFRVRFLEELRRLGYPAVGAESLIFDRDNSGQARLLLGGTITGLHCVGASSFRR